MDLIERLRASIQPGDYLTSNVPNRLIYEAAAALEAAREDAQRCRAARRMLADPIFTSDAFVEAVYSRNAKAIDAAIDQARDNEECQNNSRSKLEQA